MTIARIDCEDQTLARHELIYTVIVGLVWYILAQKCEPCSSRMIVWIVETADDYASRRRLEPVKLSSDLIRRPRCSI